MAAHYDKFYEELAEEARKRSKKSCNCNCKGCNISRDQNSGYQPCHHSQNLKNLTPPKEE